MLAVQRWLRRSLKQMGVGFLSLILVWGITTQGTQAQPLNDLYKQKRPAATMQMSVPSQQASRQLTQTSALTDDPATKDTSTALPDGDKPFQALRPKMTYHRLTTSRLSIPAADYRAIANLSDSETVNKSD